MRRGCQRLDGSEQTLPQTHQNGVDLVGLGPPTPSLSHGVSIDCRWMDNTGGEHHIYEYVILISDNFGLFHVPPRQSQHRHLSERLHTVGWSTVTVPWLDCLDMLTNDFRRCSDLLHHSVWNYRALQVYRIFIGWTFQTESHISSVKALWLIWLCQHEMAPVYLRRYWVPNTKITILRNWVVYVLLRFDDIRHIHKELWSPDVGMVIKES